MSQHSAACCTVSPVVAEGYQPKGSYKTINGLSTYVTGPSEATHAILVVYDIFGFFSQTIQGADILAHSDKSHQYQVYIPDFFQGSPADISWYPPDTKEKGEKLGAFFQNEAEPTKTLTKIPEVIAEIEVSNSNIKGWAIVGYCWGGKIVSLSTAGDTKFKAGAELHPAMVDPKDAEKISIPLCMLASKDEDPDAVSKFEANLKGKKHVETFGDQVHGWMAARADLGDKRVKEEYERGYKTLLKFLHDNL